jgi:hypothetical protein
VKRISLAIVALAVGWASGPLRAEADAAEAGARADFVAPEGQALVVFIQNQRVDRKMTFTVFGADKRCVAEVGGREAQVLPTPPGPYLFYVLGYGTTYRIELYMEAGRTYFVRLHTVDRPVGRAPAITLVRRASESHKLLRHWLDGASVTRTLDNEGCYGRPLKERANRTQRRLNEANAGWKEADEVTRDKYMLIERDGLTASDISRL